MCSKTYDLFSYRNHDIYRSPHVHRPDGAPGSNGNIISMHHNPCPITRPYSDSKASPVMHTLISKTSNTILLSKLLLFQWEII